MDNPSELPPAEVRDCILEPYVRQGPASLHLPRHSTCSIVVPQQAGYQARRAADPAARLQRAQPGHLHLTWQNEGHPTNTGTKCCPNPDSRPDRARRMEIITPSEYVGTIMELSQQRRGDFEDMQYLTEARTTLVYSLPLAEVRLAPQHSPATVMDKPNVL